MCSSPSRSSLKRILYISSFNTLPANRKKKKKKTRLYLLLVQLLICSDSPSFGEPSVRRHELHCCVVLDTPWLWARVADEEDTFFIKHTIWLHCRLTFICLYGSKYWFFLYTYVVLQTWNYITLVRWSLDKWVAFFSKHWVWVIQYIYTSNTTC